MSEPQLPEDPTRLLNQPALTSSTGRIWLIVGGLFALVSLAVLIPLTTLPPNGVALGAAIAVVVLYCGMLAVRLTVPAGRRRLGLMAAGMIAIAVVALIAVGIVASTAFTLSS